MVTSLVEIQEYQIFVTQPDTQYNLINVIKFHWSNDGQKLRRYNPYFQKPLFQKTYSSYFC